MILTDKQTQQFIESWFGKRPDETMGQCFERYANQPNAMLRWLAPDPRDQHDPGDEDVLR